MVLDTDPRPALLSTSNKEKDEQQFKAAEEVDEMPLLKPCCPLHCLTVWGKKESDTNYF